MHAFWAVAILSKPMYCPKSAPKQSGSIGRWLNGRRKKPIRDEATSPKKAFGRVMDESWVDSEPWCGGGRIYGTSYIKTFSPPPFFFLSLPPSSSLISSHPSTANRPYSKVAAQLQTFASVSIYTLFATRSPAHHVCRRSAHDPSSRKGRERACSQAALPC